MLLVLFCCELSGSKAVCNEFYAYLSWKVNGLSLLHFHYELKALKAVVIYTAFSKSGHHMHFLCKNASLVRGCFSPTKKASSAS